MTDFRVQSLDHVEFFVPDQYDAAAWYDRVLGLTIVPDFEHWAAEGPLMISSDGGRTMLALFRGEGKGQRPTAGFHRVAFRVGAGDFLKFLDRLAAVSVSNRDGQPLGRDEVVDHGRSWSIYFEDPFGHLLELTSYDYTELANELKR